MSGWTVQGKRRISSVQRVPGELELYQRKQSLDELSLQRGVHGRKRRVVHGMRRGKVQGLHWLWRMHRLCRRQVQVDGWLWRMHRMSRKNVP